MPAALQLANLCRGYGAGEARIDVLRGVDLTLEPGEMVALVAPSGAGKSTLLHLSGLLEAPESGEVFIGEYATSTMSEAERTRLRRFEIGFVYQFHHLLPEFSALENVILPQRIAGLDPGEAAQRAEEVLAFLGLGHRLYHRPAELSGGERQRVAIARAVANSPRLLLADEPTGNLDPETGMRVFTTLRALVSQSGLGALIATHNLELAARMDRRITLEHGRCIDC
jgi:lipoprotein-releasing system ATP-binding protein